MKIKVLSNDEARFTAIKRAVVAKAPTADVSQGVGLAEELPSYINGSVPDMVIVDGATPRSLEAIEVLNRHKPDVDIVVTSIEASVDFLMQAMRAGVREVVPLPYPDGALEEAIGRIQQKRHLPKWDRGRAKCWRLSHAREVAERRFWQRIWHMCVQQSKESV